MMNACNVFAQVSADYKSVAFTPDISEKRKMQSETLSAVFETYFRILKHAMQSTAARFAPTLFGLIVVTLNL